MKQHLCIGLLSLATLAGGCTSHTAPVSTGEFHSVAVNNFAKTWTVDLGLSGAKATNVYLFDNLIIVYADDSTAHVVDRHSGRLLFINPLPTRSGTLHAPAVFADQIVYPATSSFKVYSAKTGVLLKDINVPFAIRTGGTGSGTNFYVSADYDNGGRIIAFDLSRNNTLPRWEIMTVAAMRGAPVLYQGILFFASEDGLVRAVSEERGGVWSLDDHYDGAFAASGPIISDIRVDETAVYFASMDTKLYALSRSSGKIKWQYFAGVPLEEAPMTTNDTLYINVKGQGLTAINKLEGEHDRKVKWIAADAVKFLADDDKYSYVLLASHQVAALDKATGERKFLSTRNDLGPFGVNPKDGLVYAVDRNGSLLQIKPVIKQGIVGELVMDVRPLEIASR